MEGADGQGDYELRDYTHTQLVKGIESYAAPGADLVDHYYAFLDECGNKHCLQVPGNKSLVEKLSGALAIGRAMNSEAERCASEMRRDPQANRTVKRATKHFAEETPSSVEKPKLRIVKND